MDDRPEDEVAERSASPSLSPETGPDARATVLRRSTPDGVDQGLETVLRPLEPEHGADLGTIMRPATELSTSVKGDETIERRTDTDHVDPVGSGLAPEGSALVDAASAPIGLAVYRPREARAARRMYALIVVGAVIVVAAVAVLAVSLRDGHSSRSGGAVLHAERIAISTDPSLLLFHCPQARVLYTATVFTNGAAGTLRYQWTDPVGGQEPSLSAPLHAGDHEVRTTLNYTFSGSGAAQGVAQFHVLAPNALQASAPAAAYECP